MWLTAFECPDANTINCFRVGPMAVLFLSIDRGKVKFDALMIQIFEDGKENIKISEALNEKLDLGRELMEQRLSEVPKDKELKKAIKQIDGWIERKDRSGGNFYVDEKRSYAKRTTQARIEYSDGYR